jgi:hypothetical protein
LFSGKEFKRAAEGFRVATQSTVITSMEHLAAVVCVWGGVRGLLVVGGGGWWGLQLLDIMTISSMERLAAGAAS